MSLQNVLTTIHVDMKGGNRANLFSLAGFLWSQSFTFRDVIHNADLTKELTTECKTKIAVSVMYIPFFIDR